VVLATEMASFRNRPGEEGLSIAIKTTPPPDCRSTARNSKVLKFLGPKVRGGVGDLATIENAATCLPGTPGTYVVEKPVTRPFTGKQIAPYASPATRYRQLTWTSRG
jgi:hypothetical protein